MRKLIYTSLAFIFVCLGTLIPAYTSFASSTASDSLVVIAQDATAETHCSASTILNVGTPKQTTVDYACPAGSIIKTETVYLSQTEAQHEQYVVLPDPSSSQKVIGQAFLQIQQLETTVRDNAARNGPKISNVPKISCGSNATPSRNWTANGDSVHTYVNYTKSYDCSTVFIQFSGVQGNTAPNPLYWNYDAYASWSHGAGCPFVGTNNWSINWDITQPEGYGFEHWLENKDCPWYGYTSYNDYIVLN